MSTDRTPEEVLAEGAETYATKNEDYGDSWRQVGLILHILADGETVELEEPADHISYGLFTRRLDKLARAYHGEFFGDDPNHEPIVDAHEDEAVYAAMAASHLLSDGGPRIRPESEGTGAGDRDADQAEQAYSGTTPGLPAAPGEVPATERGSDPSGRTDGQ